MACSVLCLVSSSELPPPTSYVLVQKHKQIVLLSTSHFYLRKTHLELVRLKRFFEVKFINMQSKSLTMKYLF